MCIEVGLWASVWCVLQSLEKGSFTDSTILCAVAPDADHLAEEVNDKENVLQAELLVPTESPRR
jgi:hypothetical protein